MVDDGSRSEKWLDTLSAVLMGLATVATAWCGFQAAIWGGIQTFRLADAQGRSRAANTAVVTGRQIATLDAQLFMAWLEARVEEREELAQFYWDRFRPPMRKATSDWLETRPRENADAPLTPFRMPTYDRPGEAESERLEAESAQARERAAHANSTGDKYVLGTVLLASVVFFGGTAPRIRTRKAGWSLFIMAIVILVSALLHISRLAVSFGA